MKNIVCRALAVSLAVMTVNPNLSFATVSESLQNDARYFGVSAADVATATPIPASTAKIGARDLSSRIAQALNEVDANATAVQVLKKAGIEPGSLTREQVYAAFEPSVGVDRLNDLSARLDAQYGVDHPALQSSLADLNVTAIAGEQSASIVLVALGLAAVIALAGCMTIHKVTGTTGMDNLGTTLTPERCATLAALLRYNKSTWTGYACYGSK